MLTQERALEIRRACQDLAIGGEPWEDQLARTMTIEEIQEVNAYWQSLPNSATFENAFEDYLQNTRMELG